MKYRGLCGTPSSILKTTHQKVKLTNPSQTNKIKRRVGRWSAFIRHVGIQGSMKYRSRGIEKENIWAQIIIFFIHLWCIKEMNKWAQKMSDFFFHALQQVIKNPLSTFHCIMFPFHADWDFFFLTDTFQILEANDCENYHFSNQTWTIVLHKWM